MDKKLNGWKDGLVSAQEIVAELECNIVQFLDTLARDACRDNCPLDVHFYVEAERKVSRILRQVEHRLPRQHRF
jgi:hypothetical protein